ncbi:metal ABC transporter permease [Salmonella enterica subsp. enterica]|nr:metal ABC transporter permease [Salmonella enterica subsp. enterica]
MSRFGYQYMLNAMWCSAMVGVQCAFLSCYLMLKRLVAHWRCAISLYYCGVAGARMLGAAFLARRVSFRRTGGGMLFLNQRSRLKEDAIIGLIFSLFFLASAFLW